MTIKQPANPKSIAIDVDGSTALIMLTYNTDTKKSSREQKIAAEHLRAAMATAIEGYFKQHGR